MSKTQSKQLVNDGVRVILIDYIQLFKNFNEIGDKIIHELKELAERFGFTIIVFSQIDRSSEYDEDNIFENKYTLLGGFSNEIINNADVFCVLHHPTLHEGEAKEDIACMYILKSTDSQNNI
ncbi:DnaB-like helicase C-terminal domain-containing protein [Muribaculum intestinale]|uniref:DnaB-like helicase C-terminal domain-containing protein n=1 Tax=Muribaculum intestinale TaxID=1796646 RepID=UPI0034E468C0